MIFTIDPAHTSAAFVARHMGLSKVRGRFTRLRGRLEGDPSDPTSARGRVEIDVASVDTGNPDRDAHLRSPDFFDADNYPWMVFEATRVEDSGGGAYKVVGNLTIRDVTREIELDYEHGGEGIDPFGNRKIGGTLTGTVNRRDWGLNWNVPLDTGGVLVSEKIRLEIDFQLLAEPSSSTETDAVAS